MDRDSQKLKALIQMVEDVSSELELKPLLTRLIQNACELIGADDGTVGLYDPVKNVIRTEAVYHMPARELGAEMGPGIGLAGKVLATREPVYARYGDLADIPLPELAENEVVGMPVFWREQLIGFFGVGAHAGHSFSEQDLTLLLLFARHAGIAIENARRYAAERRRSQRFALIANVASMAASADTELSLLQQVADAMHDMLGFPNIDIPLLDPEDAQVLVIRVRGGDYKHRIKHVDRIPVSRGIMGAAVTERCTQCVNDVSRDPRYITPPGVIPPQAELAVPILLRGEAIGIINVESDQRFDELDVVSLEIIASALAVGLENNRLFREAQQAAITAERGRLARDLHDNVTQILSSISLMAQSLPLAWKRDASEGERRAMRLHELAQTGFAELRALLKELSPTQVRADISKSGLAFLGLERLKDLGLPAAIEPLLKRMASDSHQLYFDFNNYVPQVLEHEEAFYRVCQEAVSNVLKHAEATSISVATRVSPQIITLRIADDGKGIQQARRDGLGLDSMRTRMKHLGGVFRTVANVPRGTVIEVALPRQDRSLRPG